MESGQFAMRLLIMKMMLFFMMMIMQRLAMALSYTETKALLDLKTMLENPAAIAGWSYSTDFCNLQPSNSVALICEEGYLTRLTIVGDRTSPAAMASSNSVSEQSSMLPQTFSSEALFLHLTNFTKLKALQLANLGLWGVLPSKLGRLNSLQSLNLSSNFFYGVLPNRIMSLQSLQTLILDDNLLNATLPQRWNTLPWLLTLSLANNKIQGNLPPSLFSDLHSLRTLVLDNNQLTGTIPASLSNCTTIQALSLAGNRLNGIIPDLRALPYLMALNLQNNELGPHFPYLGTQVLYLALDRNRFQGPIPASIANLTQLQQLDLSNNLFSGVPTAALFSLPNIKYLTFARNRLSGILPDNMTLSSSLKLMDFSYNLITGPLPPQLTSLIIKGTKVQFQWNCLSTTLQPQNPFSYCQNAALATGIGPQLQANERKPGNNARIAVLVGIGGGVLVVAVATLILLSVILRRRQSSQTLGKPIKPAGTSAGPCMDYKAVAVSSELLSSARYISRTMKLGGLGYPQFRVFSMDELYKATDYFHDSALIGEGTRGKVYKGQLDDGTLVAIKRLRKEDSRRAKLIKSRIERLGKFRNAHLVSLLGYNIVGEDDPSSPGVQVCLIYEYVSSRTLRNRLAGRGSDGFGWTQRLLVIIGAAKGLRFLHFGSVPGVFDNEISSKNILLDQNLVPKLSDFGLSFSQDMGHAEGRLQTSKGTSPMEKQRKELVDKKDVYNFGLVLLEVLIGKPPTVTYNGPRELESLLGEAGPRLELALDPRIAGCCNMEALDTVVEITVKCLSQNPLQRPSMEDVLWNLQYALQVQGSSSNGGSQDTFNEDPYPDLPKADLQSSRSQRKAMATTVGKVASEEVGKPSSPNTEFFR